MVNNGIKILNQIFNEPVDHIPTITKTRFYSGNHQFFRLDQEEDLSSVTRDYSKINLENFDAIIVSDYNKGIITNITDFLKNAKDNLIPTFIDPKKNDLESYKNAFLIKPNLEEYKKIFETNFNETHSPIGDLSKQSISNLLVTRSSSGMALINSDYPLPKLYPVEAKGIVDVTGAGDTVIATLVCYYLDTKNIDISITKANFAASISVSKFGTYAVTKRQIEANETNQRDGKLVFTNGCFDLLHEGHLSLLQYCSKLGERLIVGINSDDSVRRLKGDKRPINNQLFRKKLLESLYFVNEVIIFDDDTPINLIRKLRPDILVKGGDYQEDEVIGGDFIKKLGGVVEIFPLEGDHSSTKMIERMTQ
jgi:D-beta-D-heptose 7-phosphate kinase/D-beta-D-heptose 1-phosphate adenosyltransferase